MLKKILKVCRAAAAVGVLCLPPLAAQAADSPLSKDEIRFGVGMDPSYSPVYYAAQHKMFEKAGLNVQLAFVPFGADAVDAVIAGQNQLSGAAEYAVLTRAARGPVQAFAIFGQSDSYIKLAVRKGITKPEQIKKFGIVSGSAGEYVSRKLISKNHIDPASVTWVRGAPPEFPALLARGDVDAYFLWDPWPERSLSVGGAILMNSGQVGYSYNMLIASSEQWLKQHPAEARAVVQVLNDACQEIRKDPEKAVAATKAATKMPADQVRKLLSQIECTVRDFTPQDLARYGDIANFQHNIGSTAKQVDVNTVFQTGYVKGR